MQTNESDLLDALEYSEKTAKRATHEDLQLTPLANGRVEVENASHADPEDHSYVVSVERGIPFSCQCPAWEYHDGACKHMVRVAMAEPVIDAAGGHEPRVATDGGSAEWTERAEALADGGTDIIDAGDEGVILEDGDDQDDQDEGCPHGNQDLVDEHGSVGCPQCFISGGSEAYDD
jgi:hypothetical protein